MAEAKELDKESILLLIHTTAQKWAVSEAIMLAIIKCENPEFNPMLQSYVLDKSGPNSREDSWGLSQIHLPSHPYISKAQAQDPVFAVTFLAENLKKNKGNMWSCFKSPVKDV